MPESLIALGILVVAAILLDGVRRARNARRDSLHMMDKMHQGMDRDSLDELGNEFPNGAARVVTQRNTEDDELATTETAHKKADFAQVAPILLDVKDERPVRIEPELGLDDLDENFCDGSDIDEEKIAEASQAEEIAVPMARGVRNASPVFDTATQPLGLGESEIVSEPRIYERPADKPAPRREPTVQKPSKSVLEAREERERAQQAASEPKNQQLPLDDLVIVGVMARDRSGFSGAALLELFLERGLRFGHYGLFHYYTGEQTEKESLFSVANILNPGSFDYNQMDNFQTPGITMFLSMGSLHGNTMEVFDLMLETARAIASRLNGELRDDQRSVLTNQTIEHNRQRIRQFEMQSRMRAR
ncbi:MAG TPA: cell division protein ZipA [Pseudomonadales bacterium]|jgi:cell division protein ZipA|nr:cell division protein ZipA [Pseudomonadales bacterium]